MADPHLLLISGALRKGSFNRKLLAEAARAFGPATTEWAELRFPLYDGDLEDASGAPAEVQAVADQIARADAVLISGPEYNHSISGVLKNGLDWISRLDGNPWLNKPVALMSAAGGRAGGARGQFALRLAMTPFRPRLVTGPEVLVAGAAGEFDEAGRLTSQQYQKTLTSLMQALKDQMS